ncbi:MAG: hypothetical protein HY690_02615 [Chloroflexi bacterium]|nr:hypothetical protein [Chloroflexota bacterium]
MPGLNRTASPLGTAGCRRRSSCPSSLVPESWEETAEELLAQHDDQDFSYVDATSFVAMRRLGLQDAFAFDHHFAILGFALVGDQGRGHGL